MSESPTPSPRLPLRLVIRGAKAFIAYPGVDEKDDWMFDAPGAFASFEPELAQFLMRSVNAHAALVEALKQIVANSEEDNEWDAVEKLKQNLQTARAALALTEAK